MRIHSRTKQHFVRRIGGTEIDATLVCKAYAVGRYDYFNNGDWDEDQVSEYAEKLLSSPGKKDGLYWEVVGDEEQSPLGRLVALAAGEGYTRKKGTGAQTAAPLNHPTAAGDGERGQ